MKPALIVFAKSPVPGEVKTRLSPMLDHADAAKLYTAFLEDSIHQYASLEIDLRLYVAPPADGLTGIDRPPSLSVLEQKGDDLGARMARAFAETFAAGHERIAIIGTDHPTLPSSFIELAFDSLLEPGSVAIGPAEDGGYYLLGMNDFMPQLFRDMTYSHPDVLRETLERAETAAAHLTVLPAWYDVDTPAALERLASEMEALESVAPRTRKVLRDLATRH